VGLVIAANYGTEYRGYAFLGVLGLLTVELNIIGWLVNDRPVGAFVDTRNRISLSKLQAGAWTVVVLAALSTVAVYNLLGRGADAGTTDLDIAIPGELLLAMGISATSMVAAPALLSLKAANGVLDTNDTAHEASWGDLVTGDETGNAESPDLGKIQQLLITVLLLGCYAGYVFIKLSSREAPIHALPVLDKTFVWLLGLSHASYLAYKATPHTPPEG
jgi:hypothetical protein